MGSRPLALLPDLALEVGASHTVLAVQERADALATVVEINRQLAHLIAASRDDRTLVLSGNCNVALGACTAIDERPLAVIWFDAHADFNTPETTTSGFVDGMSLAALCGRWRVPGGEFATVDESHVVLVGARDLDDAEADALAASRVARASNAAELRSALENFPSDCTRAYIHVDMDALDPSQGRANTFAAPGGLTLEELLACVDAVAERFTWDVATISAYDPAADSDRRVAGAIVRIAQRLVTSG